MVTDCKSLGVELHIIHQEAIQLTLHGENLQLHLADGHKIQTGDIVLTSGNFCSTSHKEQFCGNPNYFRCLWPIAKLNDVVPDVDVFVMGSTLTAIDVAIALVEREHKGVITFISHSGRLPKVQGKQSMNERRHVLASLAKEVESLPLGNNMFKVVAKFVEELDHVDVKDFAHVLVEIYPAKTLRTDIAKAGISYNDAVLASLKC
jgi:uncharacterized NAD(P)/FAD-binding protein YdhS